MIEINLLPWRQYLREEKRKKSNRLIAIIIFPMLFFIAGHFIFNNYVERETDKTKKLMDQVSLKQLQSQPDESTHGVEELQQEREVILQKLLALSQENAGDIELIKIDYIHHKMNITGYAKSVADLSQWVKASKADIEVTQIKNTSDSFRLKFQAIIS